jgi:1-aminocyclopropane-1-carboxylate deaminase/D-cysteine desulfhydrase-like pyridoxal-dependent ACC family enzyme
VINPGAASPRANLGYVDAMLELAAQVDRGEMPRPDVIVLPVTAPIICRALLTLDVGAFGSRGSAPEARGASSFGG